MNRHITRQPVLALLLVILALPSVAATPATPAQKQLIAKVFTDGTLFGFAKACELSEPDLKALYDKTFASSRQIGVAKVPQYSQQDFRRDFQSGIATADRFSASVKPSSEAYKKNCEDVREKVNSIIKTK